MSVRSEQSTVTTLFDEEVRSGVLGKLPERQVVNLLHSRGTLYFALVLGKLEKARFGIQIQPKGDAGLRAPVTIGTHEGAKWFDLVLPNGLTFVERTKGGLFAIPFTAHGGMNYRPRVELDGPKEATGKLAIFLGFQTGMGL